MNDISLDLWFLLIAVAAAAIAQLHANSKT